MSCHIDWDLGEWISIRSTPHLKAFDITINGSRNTIVYWRSNNRESK